MTASKARSLGWFSHTHVWVGVLLLAVLVRVWFSLSSGLWLDEAFSVVESAKPLLHVLTLGDNTPPLYYLLLHGWMRIFGTGELAVRMLSVLFGSLLVLLVHRRVGWRASLLVAVWPPLVEFSAQARSYSLFVLAAAWLLFMACQHEDRPLLGFLAATLTVLSHAYGSLFVLAALLLKRRSARWYLGQGLAILIFLSWAAIRFLSLDTQTIAWIPLTSWSSLPGTWYFLTSGGAVTFVGVLLAVFAFALVVLRVRDARLGSWILGPPLIGLLAGVLLPIFQPKYVLPSAAGLLVSLKDLRRALYWVLVLLAFAATISLMLAPRNLDHSRFFGVQETIFYAPPAAQYPLLYYAAPECLGRPDTYRCASQEGLELLNYRHNPCLLRSDEVLIVGLSVTPEVIGEQEVLREDAITNYLTVQRLDCRRYADSWQ